MHTITHLINLPAKNKGELDGIGAVCSCGTVIAASLQTMANQWGREHCNYYNAKEAS